MKQVRQNIPGISRQIKRDLVSSTSKGIAGLTKKSLKRLDNNNEAKSNAKPKGRGRGRKRKNSN